MLSLYKVFMEASRSAGERGHNHSHGSPGKPGKGKKGVNNYKLSKGLTA